MSDKWDEAWAAAAPVRRRRGVGMRLVFGVVLALMAVMVGVTRWRGTPPAGPGQGIVAGDLRASSRDQLHGAFAPCHGGHRVTCVVDGDTIWYSGEKIRISDINAPEISHPECDYELDLGNKARDRLVALLNAGPFSLDATERRDTDKYGRKLREITRGGKSVGAVLVSEGLAEVWVGHRRNWCH